MSAGLHMPLSTVPAGRTVVLRRVRDGHGLTSRLAAMGLVPGVVIAVHQNHRGGPLVVGVKEGRLMLGRGMAERMAVE